MGRNRSDYRYIPGGARTRVRGPVLGRRVSNVIVFTLLVAAFVTVSLHTNVMTSAILFGAYFFVHYKVSRRRARRAVAYYDPAHPYDER